VAAAFAFINLNCHRPVSICVLFEKTMSVTRPCFDRSTAPQVSAETNSRDKPYGSLREISINYLSVPFSENFEQPVTITQRVNGVLLVCRFDGIFKPGGYAWICKDLFESHISV
jgi:hypothetical protein